MLLPAKKTSPEKLTPGRPRCHVATATMAVLLLIHHGSLLSTKARHDANTLRGERFQRQVGGPRARFCVHARPLQAFRGVDKRSQGHSTVPPRSPPPNPSLNENWSVPNWRRRCMCSSSQCEWRPAQETSTTTRIHCLAETQESHAPSRAPVSEKDQEDSRSPLCFTRTNTPGVVQHTDEAK